MLGRESTQPAPIVHAHGLWRSQTRVGAQMSGQANTRLVVSAHGMLDEWALRNKRWKKVVYGFVERANLRRTACLHALTEAEVLDYRRFGIRNPVAIIPNGVEVPESLDPEPFLGGHPECRNRQLLLYLGRIHYKKGVDLLARTWARVAPQFPDARLVYAGPDSENTLSSLKALIDELGVAGRVTFTGMLEGPAKWSALAAAHTFVLPSYSEGFSVATLEALAAARPVIVTDACRFPEIAERQCGWVVRPASGALEAALVECLNASQTRLEIIGENGRELVRTRYEWSTIGRQMSDVYDWILGGLRPTSVEIRT
jgi:glycosyltransferase involved in cell wall biosynthesis